MEQRRKKDTIESSKSNEENGQEIEELEDEEDEEEDVENIKKFDYDYFFDLLSDENFYLQIRFLAFIINKINKYNII